MGLVEREADLGRLAFGRLAVNTKVGHEFAVYGR
jgi:hypothetical protein